MLKYYLDRFPHIYDLRISFKNNIRSMDLQKVGFVVTGDLKFIFVKQYLINLGKFTKVKHHANVNINPEMQSSVAKSILEFLL